MDTLKKKRLAGIAILSWLHIMGGAVGALVYICDVVTSEVSIR